jgi:peptide-methionine (R)-S-oxide reductase
MTQLTPNRRNVLAVLAGAAAMPLVTACGASPANAATFKVKLTDAEWKKKLSPAAYQVLRHEDTERPFTSPLNKEHRKGTFVCAGCANQLFSSATKFESGTGWPSFWQPLPGAVGKTTDHFLGYPRTAVFCADCGGHLGHVFDDGPKPTGLRYCMNGVAMAFRAA